MPINTNEGQTTNSPLEESPITHIETTSRRVIEGLQSADEDYVDDSELDIKINPALIKSLAG